LKNKEVIRLHNSEVLAENLKEFRTKKIENETLLLPKIQGP
jgi:hypothetical protein